MSDKFTYEQLHTPMDAPIQYQREQQKREHEKMMEELPKVLKAMTKPDYQSVVTALEVFAHHDLCKQVAGNAQGNDSPVFGRDKALLVLGDFRRAAEALPLARSMVEKLERYDELVEKAEALEWVIAHKEYLGVERVLLMLAAMPNCPAIIKRYLGDKV